MLQFKVAPSIKTNRLTIRIVDINDTTDYFEICSDPRVCAYLTFKPFKTLTNTRFVLENMQNAYIHGSDVNFSVILNQTNKVIGSISLHFFENENIAEIGYLFNYDFWNNGYCSEAIDSLINVAFTYYNVDCVVASYFKDNIVSEKVLAKFGFEIYDVIKDGFIKDKILYDLVKVRLCRKY